MPAAPRCFTSMNPKAVRARSPGAIALCGMPRFSNWRRVTIKLPFSAPPWRMCSISDAGLNRLKRPVGNAVEHDEARHDEGGIGLVGLVGLWTPANFSHDARPLLLDCATRLEGGFGKVDDASGVLDIFRRVGPEFPPFVRKPDLDEAAWLCLNKNWIVLVWPRRLGNGLEPLKQRFGLTRQGRMSRAVGELFRMDGSMLLSHELRAPWRKRSAAT